MQWDLLRLDLIHPVISGNKYFKLRYYLEDAIRSGHQGLISFGGAYSNHILATAFAAKKAGLKSIGFIRGEEPSNWSDTLVEARTSGMELIFTERKQYSTITKAPIEKWKDAYPGFTIILEGGYGIMGMLGAAEIHRLIPAESYDWVVCACGTGTMMAGLLQGATAHQQILGIPVLKNYISLESEILALLSGQENRKAIYLEHGYHFGGYAKKTPELIQFMNDFYQINKVPTDFIYTGKLMYAIDKLIGNGYFPPNCRILAIHSGGLQGNRSLKKGILAF